MAGKNQVFQKVSLDSKDYLYGLRSISKEQQETANKVAKSLTQKVKNHKEASEEIKKNNLKVISSMKEMGKWFGENIKKGTVVAGGVALASAFKSSAQEATRSILTLDQGMARIQSRFDLSSQKVKNLGSELKKLSTITGIDGGSMVKTAEELISASGNKKQAIGIDSIAKFSAMGGGDAPEIARMVVDYLKGTGQEFNEENVKNLLTSAVASNRGGDISLEDSLRSLVIDPATKKKLGLSNKENAAMISAASGIGENRGTSIAGLNALLAKSVAGFGEGSALSGILGVGSFTSNGKFDLSKLSEASANFNKQGLSQSDFIKLMESTGLSSQEAEGLYSILKDFDTFEGSFKKVLSDQKTLEESFGQSTDNLSDSFARMNQSIAKATQEILSPSGQVLKKILDGNLWEATKSAPGAIADTAGAAWDNKGMVGLGLGGLALTGAIATKLGGLLGGVSKGLSVEELTQGKVQAVYVVNLKELAGTFGGSGLDSAGKIAGAGGLGALLSKIGGSKLFGMLVKGSIHAAPYAGAAAAGYAGYQIGDKAVNPLIDKFTQGKTADGFEGNAVERLIYSIEKLIGTEDSKNIQRANKIQVEIVDRQGRFTNIAPMNDISSEN